MNNSLGILSRSLIKCIFKMGQIFGAEEFGLSTFLNSGFADAKLICQT